MFNRQSKFNYDDVQIIGGKPIDFHIIQDYLLNVSPYDINSLLRYDNIATLEEIKMLAKTGDKFKMNWKLIIIAVILMVIGIIAIMFLPKIIGMFGGK